MLDAPLQERFSAAGQAHVLRFWDQLSPAQQQSFAAELSALDLDLLRRLARGDQHAEDWAALAQRAEPPQAVRLDAPLALRDEARRLGAQALAAGQVAAILVAGGQGTRLGFDHPKGMYPIGPVSRRSLLQIFCEQLLAVGHEYGVVIPLYIMTSPATHAETAAYLAENRRFGLAEKNCNLFCQGTMPSLDAQSGRLLLADRSHLALSPDGHGGTLAALARCGALDQLSRRDVRQLFYFQVDNPLVSICDEEFIGHHLRVGSEMSTQVVAKARPDERVGHVVDVDGRARVIEYSDLPRAAAAAVNAGGAPRLWAGSIAVHVFDIPFLTRMAAQADALPFHRARKIVPFLDDQGALVEPIEPNAIKFERFIFDLMPAAERTLTMEVDRAKSFAPLKNADDEPTDNPTTVRRQMTALHREWLRQAGVEVAEDATVEIGALAARHAAAVRLRRNLPPRVAGEFYLG